MIKENTKLYTSNFFERWKGGSLQSANVIVPMVLELENISSVVDMGCGTGAWLSIFKKYGIKDICGIDGEYVKDNVLEISPQQFKRHDLNQFLDLGRTYDLVASLEVGEHLPKQNAENFVSTLVRHGPMVLFSAAIPFQPGIGHINNQWQDYWANLFDKKNYVAIDCIRPRVWNNKKVEWWYSQNTILYANKELLLKNDKLNEEHTKTNLSKLNLVHPKNIVSRFFLWR